jgi:hypothetical protein
MPPPDVGPLAPDVPPFDVGPLLVVIVALPTPESRLVGLSWGFEIELPHATAADAESTIEQPRRRRLAVMSDTASWPHSAAFPL